MIFKRNNKGQIVRRTTGVLFEGMGVWFDAKGYACICINGKDIKLHVYVWERVYGKIPIGFQLHHIDWDKRNYSLDNLMLVTQPDHFKIHAGWIKTNGIWTHKPCNGCGKILSLDMFYERKGRTPCALCKGCHNKATTARRKNNRMNDMIGNLL